VHEARRVQHGATSSLPQSRSGHAMKLRVGGRKQRIARLSASAMNLSQENGELTHRMPCILHWFHDGKDSASA
jgi:hypothetical protein